MMNCMGDGIDHFAPECRPGDWRSAASVADFTARSHWGVERTRRKLLERGAHLPRERERERGLRFEARVAFASIIINFISVETAEQACEMVQAVAVMATDGSVEGEWHALRVVFGSQRAKQVFTLCEDGDGGI